MQTEEINVGELVRDIRTGTLYIVRRVMYGTVIVPWKDREVPLYAGEWERA